MNNFRFSIITGLFLLGLGAGSAMAESLYASDPFGILKALRSEGLEGTIAEDSYGDPKISSETADSKFVIFFYNCDNGSNCGTIQFRASYDLGKPTSLDSMNSWNQTKLYGRTYVGSDGEAVIEHVVSMTDDGIGVGNFSSIVQTWSDVVSEFEDYIGF